MPSTISLRIYLLSVQRRGNQTKLPFDRSRGGIDLPEFLKGFVFDCSSITEDVDKERSWYFDVKTPVSLAHPGNSRGYIHYGTYGFESNLVDNRTRESRYKRKTTDSEIVPLFYEFWHPPKAEHIFLAFQSFQGRSCVTLVMQGMQKHFDAYYPNFLLRFKKLIPNDSAGSIYRGYPVQKLTLIKRNVSSDIADKYTGTRPGEAVNLEVSLVARRKGSVGNFDVIVDSFKPNKAGVLVHEGPTFDEAIASVRVGGRTRSVGIFGGNSEAGVIDLSDAVERSASGHPTFKSISEETDVILKEYHAIIGI